MEWGGEFVLYRNAFFMPLQIEPGYNPPSAQGRECSGFSSFTDLCITTEVRTSEVLFVTGKGNVTIMMEIPSSAVSYGL